jgi:uncharacterized membrane protein YkvA (DUF1232 family)
VRLDLEPWKRRAKQLKAEVYAVYLAYRDPRTPWYARLWAAAVVGYAFSPIDLIPDFVPVLGYLDDLLIVPLGIVVALKLIPAEVMIECRAKAQTAMSADRPMNRWGAVLIIAIWMLLAALGVWLVVRLMKFGN